MFTQVQIPSAQDVSKGLWEFGISVWQHLSISVHVFLMYVCQITSVFYFSISVFYFNISVFYFSILLQYFSILLQYFASVIRG